MNEFNFFKSSLESDRDLFFGPLEWNRIVHLEAMGSEPERDVSISEIEIFIPIEDNWTMANIMSIVGIFPSVSQARKNGWNKPIPEGFSDMRVGKSKIRVAIFKEAHE